MRFVSVDVGVPNWLISQAAHSNAALSVLTQPLNHTL